MYVILNVCMHVRMNAFLRVYMSFDISLCLSSCMYVYVFVCKCCCDAVVAGSFVHMYFRGVLVYFVGVIIISGCEYFFEPSATTISSATSTSSASHGRCSSAASVSFLRSGLGEKFGIRASTLSDFGMKVQSI